MRPTYTDASTAASTGAGTDDDACIGASIVVVATDPARTGAAETM
jgi:hypothetical protein